MHLHSFNRATSQKPSLREKGISSDKSLTLLFPHPVFAAYFNSNGLGALAYEQNCHRLHGYNNNNNNR
jgi:hypothetical protein